MAQQKDLVVLVDEQDHQTGIMEKMAAHQKGLLHRAFSVLLFNDQQQWLLQQRALDKYHCGGLWTNTCCSHPFPGEPVIDAARRRLREEMGIECALQPAFQLRYRATFDNGLTEHEYDHVFVGHFSGTPQINPSEVADWKYLSLPALRQDLDAAPERYTPWFKLIVDRAGELPQPIVPNV